VLETQEVAVLETQEEVGGRVVCGEVAAHIVIKAVLARS
jgi:hypothetical protein